MTRIFKDYYKILILIFFLTVIVGVLLIDFRNSLEDTYNQETQSSFHENAQKNVELIKNTIETDLKNLSLISSNFAYYDIFDKDEILTNLGIHVESGIIDSALIAYPNGSAHSTNRKLFNLADKRGFLQVFDNFSNGLDGNVVVADYSFTNDGSKSMQFYTPIIKNNNIIAVIAMEISQSDIQKHFCSNVFADGQESIIIKQDGEIVSSKIISYESINHFAQVACYEILGEEGIDEYKIKTQKGEDFSLNYKYNKKEYYNCYHSIGVDGLYLVSSAAMNNINTITPAAKNIEIMLIIKLFVIIAVFIFFVINIQAKTIRRIKKSENEMETLTSNIPGGVIRRTNHQDSKITYFSDGFFNLTGFSEYELDSLYKRKYNDIILEDDREKAMASLTRQLESGNCFAIEYRLNKSDTLWVLEHGQIVSEQNGEDIIYSVLVDITDSKVFQQKLEISEKRYQAIIEKTDSVVYEWNILDDTVQFSDVWYKKFGYKAITNDFVNNLEKHRIIHPDDMPKYRELTNNAKAGNAYGEIVVRIKKIPEEFVWCKVCLMTIFNSDSKPISAVGITLDVDKEKRETESMQQMAEQDSLTKLYNKCTAQRMIQEYLTCADKDETSAFMIIDIDNFKGVNDNLGHMFGDAVLSDVASKIKKIFRSTDIVGRIGGDEFAVFMKNAGSEKIIDDKVTALCEAFRQTFAGTDNNYKISGSVGIAIFNKDADNYKDLFKLADKALYYAKNSGKDRYCFYDRKMIDENELVKSQRMTRIDSCVTSDSISRSFKNNIERYVLDMLNDTRDVNSTVNMILSMLGKHYNVSRVAIYESNMDGTISTNTYEWCCEGIESIMEKFTEFRYSDYPAYLDEYNSDGVLYCTDIKNLSTKLYKFFDNLNIKSLLYISIRLKGIHRGVIGFESISESRLWTKDEIETLFFVSKILGSFVIKDRYREALLETNDYQESILNALNCAAYVIDHDNYSILFANKQLYETLPGLIINEKCYKQIMNKDEPCEDCPINKMSVQNGAGFSEIFNPLLGKWFNETASHIEWKDCDNPILFLSHDITKYIDTQKD